MNKLKILVSLALLYWLIEQYGSLALESLSRLQLVESMMYLLLAILFSFSDKLLRMWNLKLMLEKSNISIPYLRLVRISFVSMFFGLFFPGGAGPDIARVVQLKKYSQGMAKPASATIWINITTIIAACVLTLSGAGVLLFLEWPFDKEFLRVVIILSLCFMAGLFFFLNKKSQKYFRYLIETMILKNKGGLYRLTTKLFDAFSSHTEIKTLVRAVSISVIVLILAAIRTYFLSKALGLNVDLIYYMIILPVTLFITMIPVSFAGIGIREYSFIYFLGIVGVNEADAFLLGFMVTLLNIMLSVAGGIVYLYYRSALEINTRLRKSNH